MDQSALIVLMAAALLAGQPAPAVPSKAQPPVADSASAKGETPATEPGKTEKADTSGSPQAADAYLRPPIPFCRSVRVEQPHLEDIPLQRPFKIAAPAEREMLNRVAAFMRQHGCGVRIEGYADDRGSPQAILRASRERAQTVRDYLVQGLPDGERVRPEQIEVDGKGDLSDPPGLPRDKRQIARIVL